MMVGEVISNIENNANFTFDFLMLLTLAAILAFIGKGKTKKLSKKVLSWRLIKQSINQF